MIITNDKVSFVLKGRVIFHGMYVPHFLYIIIRGHRGYNGCCENATVNTGVQIPILETDFTSFGSIARSGISGSYGSSSFNF